MFNGDLIIKLAIQQGLEDIRQNPWLIDDVMGQFSDEPALRAVYGDKEIQRCKEWFLNNKIDVYLRYRNDKDQLPCVTIGLGSSSEIESMATLADQTTETEELTGSAIGKPIGYLVKPFTPTEYDPSTGFVGTPKSVKLRIVQPGMVLVDPATGNGYRILDKNSDGVIIEQGLDISASKLGIVPQFQTFKARREARYFQENYSIGCHVHGDPAALLWLHAIVLYSLLRYNEVLLEGRCFQQVSFSNTDLMPNNDYGVPNGENVFSRYINMSGQARYAWLKTPRRTIESIDLIERSNGEALSGIKIISNLTSSKDLSDPEEQLWTTIEDGQE